MSAFESRTSPRSYRVVLFLLSIVIVGLLGGAWYLWPRFEREPPQIQVTPDSEVLGRAPIEIVVSDRGAGLKSVTATLSSGSSEHTLASEQYDQPVGEKKITVALSSKLAGIKEGPAVLRVSARDRSWWNVFNGNETVLEPKGRHDPCVLPRAVPIVEAMMALVLADHALRQAARR